MRKPKYHLDEFVKLFHKEKVLTLDDLKRALGTNVKMTIFRKLKALSYRASYSDAGKYYTLDEIADYSVDGLWSFGQIHFSKYGSLKNTIEALVRASEAGYFASELQNLLHVRVYRSLLELYTSSRLLRHQIGSEYLYLSPVKRELQLKNRKELIEATVREQTQEPLPEFASPEIKEALWVFLAHLNEKQRRLYVGFESMKLGHGGDTIMSKITGMNIKTISRGRQELWSHDITPQRVRKAGGGRHPLEKKRQS
jgi:hypothetical protein